MNVERPTNILTETIGQYSVRVQELAKSGKVWAVVACGHCMCSCLAIVSRRSEADGFCRAAAEWMRTHRCPPDAQSAEHLGDLGRATLRALKAALPQETVRAGASVPEG